MSCLLKAIEGMWEAGSGQLKSGVGVCVRVCVRGDLGNGGK